MEFGTAYPSVQLADHIQPGECMTISKAALLLSAYPNREHWVHNSEYDMLSDGLTAAKKEASEGNKASSATTKPQTLRSDPREVPSKRPNESECWASSSGNGGGQTKVKIYSDYSLVLDLVAKEEPNNGVGPFTSRFEFVNDKTDADFLLILEHVKDFMELPSHQRVCQFPFEGGIVRKDLLSLTVRKYCYSDSVFSNNSSSGCNQKGNMSIPPYWWLPCYDLSTEFHMFAWEYEKNEKQQIKETSDAYRNSWIVKPAQMAQAQGHMVFPQESTCLKDIAIFVHESTTLPNRSGGDKVAQKLVRKPALIRGRKMDLRVAVVVRSFAAPFEAYMSEYFYARLANNAYNESELTDPEIVLTVNAYNENELIAGKQERESYEGLATSLGLDDYVTNDRTGKKVQRFSLVEEAIVRVMSHLFSGAGRSIGKWPKSSAYYCVDIILDWDYDSIDIGTGNSSDCDSCDNMFHTGWFKKMGIPVPKLIEVNYMGDLHAFEMAMQSLPPRDATQDITAFHTWAADLIHCTVSSEHNPCGFIRLMDLFATESASDFTIRPMSQE